jgi:hypothetical protein
MFDRDGSKVKDLDETELIDKSTNRSEAAHQIENLKRQLQPLWPPHEVSELDRRRAITAVTSILGVHVLSLHFRMFDRNGIKVKDTDETELAREAVSKDVARQMEDFKLQLENLWPPHELTRAEKDRIVAAITLIFGRTTLPTTAIFPPQLATRIQFEGEWDPRVTGDPQRLIMKAFISKADFDMLKRLLDDRVYQNALEGLYRAYNADQESATPVYEAAARAIASIGGKGLRGIAAGLLVDSLTSSGRFDDARACTVLYPEESQRFVALGAIAKSQGFRGAGDSARDWIARDAPEQYRSTLYRRVTEGELLVIEENRGRALTKGLAEEMNARQGR